MRTTHAWMLFAALGVYQVQPSLRAQEASVSASAFQGGDLKARTALLQKIRHGAAIDEAQFQTIVELGLQDASPQLRRQTCHTLVASLWSAAPGATAPVPAAGAAAGAAAKARVTPAWDKLRPALNETLDDRDPAVRLACVSAVAAVGRDTGSGPGRARLRDDAAQMLGTHYGAESDAQARAAVVQTLAFGRSRVPVVADVLGRALSDTSASVRAAAARGVAEHQVTSALPLLAKNLDDADPAVRFEAAKALSAFASGAQTYVSQLQSQLAEEKDPRVRQQLEISLKALASGQAR